MPTIYDNIELSLLDGLRGVMTGATGGDFCVGYFNLRGWDRLADLVEGFPGTGEGCCRVLVGMHRPPEQEAREAYRAVREDRPLDPPTVKRLQREGGESFKTQLEFGVPTNEAELALRQLAKQLRAGKVQVKLFLPYPLHAKLYLVHRADPVAGLVGYVGSSNLTLAGLSRNGELNVDVVEQDAARKLHDWFHRHWDHKYAIDISADLADLIENSWATEKLIRPYLVYIKMAYHLSEDARVGEKEFKVPSGLTFQPFKYQIAAVALAARHLQLRRGVLLGDVVGLGKTYMAIMTAKVLQEDQGFSTLIICPKRLERMWQRAARDNELIHEVVPLSTVTRDLPDLKRYRLVIIDESHNLRHREGRRYQAIREYIERNDCLCLMLTATPYNKQYTDLSNQLRLFLDEKRSLGVRPEMHFREQDPGDFVADHQAPVDSMVAFEQSEFAEDWRDLMRLYMVRRTRRYIMDNYAHYDPDRDRYYVTYPNEGRAYFPKRDPRKLPFKLSGSGAARQYARLYSDDVVGAINRLHLPRYGLANYLDENECAKASNAEVRIIQDLNRAGRRLMGFCRTNLFKRLESTGYSFLLSVRRHILRNMVALHALEHDLPLSIGTQDPAMLDTAISDTDDETEADDDQDGRLGFDEEVPEQAGPGGPETLESLREKAASLYEAYSKRYRTRFRWLPARYFTETLQDNLRADADGLCGVLQMAGQWDPDKDTKLDALERLLTRKHPKDKVLVFTQFADTANYLASQLQQRGVDDLRAVTGHDADPTALACRFSPVSNQYKLRERESELRVVIATDVLSEGQNVQDCHIVVNYDLPWAIIRLIQRAGRVDRIGQEHDTIIVYSFLPADGVERIINLRGRLCERLVTNQEVIGTDEQFFDETFNAVLRDLYTEKQGVLDDDDGEEVDLASVALQVWNSAPEADRAAAKNLPPITYAARAHEATSHSPDGVLVYIRTSEGHDALVRTDVQGNIASQSVSAIFQAAACAPETPPVPRHEAHHDCSAKAVRAVEMDENLSGGSLGPKRSTRRKVYERLKAFFDHERAHNSLLATQALERAINAIYQHRLTARAAETLGRQLRISSPDEVLADIVEELYNTERLVVIEDEKEKGEPQIVCSIGLVTEQGEPGNGD